MADKDKAKNAEPAAEEKPAPAPSTTPAAKFPIERLRRDCAKLFKVTTSTYDGATYGLKGEFTVEEMQNHIKKWLNTPVPTGARKERK